MKPVAVVGGGWAGLACAIHLADARIPVTLFESARQLGGRARTVTWDGLSVDNGQHLMLGAYRETLALLRRLGTQDLVERRPMALHQPGFRLRLPGLPPPLHLAVGLLQAQGLGWRDKLAAIRLMRRLKRQGFRLPGDTSAAAFLRDQPTTLVDRLWGPICLAALNTPLAQASAQVLCNVLRDSLMGRGGDSDLILNRTDLGRLVPTPAGEHLVRVGATIRLATRVQGIHACDGGYFLRGPEESFACVVLATHPAQVRDLTGTLPGLAPIHAQLDRFTWQPILTLWLRFAHTPTFPFPMLALGPGQAAWAFERSDLGDGVVSLVASATGHHMEPTAAHPLDTALMQLRRALGPLPALLAWKRIAEKRATYACVPGLSRPDNITPLPHLYLAGDYTAGPYPATFEAAVRSGVQCAHLILSRMVR
ncbi:MAG TPA: hydroxysqualene dehydroxylase HpnE [Thiobacillaceae bacterium]|nr:hydroxysqualene dehydroxylase HpnE [Thiobacillaceae bacterium]HNU63152.1 hydroxysqualene dehydroxylase HpnE [Thiobacillaceae bacterium]